VHIYRKHIAIGLMATVIISLSTQANAINIQERRAKLSHAVSKTNPVGMAAEKFIERVSQNSHGKIQITHYADAQLGNELQAMSSAQGGIIELTIVSTAGAANNIQALGIFDLPFMFNSLQEVYAVLDGPIGKELLNKLQEKNLVGLCYWDYGFRQITNNKHAITRLEDFQDLKLRVLQNRIYIDTFKALEANPLPLPYPETYTALETKAVDGQESSFLVTKSSGYHEIQKFATQTNHMVLIGVVMASKRFWDRLSADEQTILQQACDDTVIYHRKISNEMEEQVVNELVDAGMTFHKLDPAEKTRIVNATAAVTEKYKAELGADLVERTLAAIRAVRNQ